MWEITIGREILERSWVVYSSHGGREAYGLLTCSDTELPTVGAEIFNVPHHIIKNFTQRVRDSHASLQHPAVASLLSEYP